MLTGKEGSGLVIRFIFEVTPRIQSNGSADNLRWLMGTNGIGRALIAGVRFIGVLDSSHFSRSPHPIQLKVDHEGPSSASRAVRTSNVCTEPRG